MALIKKIFYELDHFKKKADVVGGMRISITFDNERDKQCFVQEMQRELTDENITSPWGPMAMKNECTIYDIKVRFP